VKIETFEPFDLADYKDAEPWVERFLQGLNQTLDRLSTLGQGNITLEDNVQGEIVSLEVAHATNTTIKLQQLKGKPLGAVLIYSGFYEHSTLIWAQGDTEEEITFQVKWDSTPSDDVAVRIMFYGQ